ncbi:hypothetical protein [Candidatus Magnetominusculus xianensis]|uniref:Uncharacterized protein n=1 Tax=Candidatus Magnetominusculus xianensis TaxID=1748249 RepID=A0ABR5SH43_9BACT|nr:hypothetical protein [Candidatus Magnetominusculus xianensis]KWT86948.1 hypothetical protein ASN18_1420 [Candidatus Magnetominusculus xianensis]MBF0403928.1 hypothetical protein [Nitrospirota bacterium]
MTQEEPAKDEKVVFFTSRLQLDKIENFRFDNRIGSRAEAIRNLIDIAIETVREKKKTSQPYESTALMAAEQQRKYEGTVKMPKKKK